MASIAARRSVSFTGWVHLCDVGASPPVSLIRRRPRSTSRVRPRLGPRRNPPQPVQPAHDVRKIPERHFRFAPVIQIGRASCRERVCTYVYISEVAVALKKRNEKPHGTRKHTTKRN